MFEKVLTPIFGVPKKGEERGRIPQPWRSFFFPRFKLESDDHFIYYQCFKVSLAIGYIFSLLNLVSWLFSIPFNFHFFEINIPKAEFVEVYVLSFPSYYSTILLSLVFPFFFIKLIVNIDVKKFDVLWWTERFANGRNRSRTKIILLALFAWVFLVWGTHGSFALPFKIMQTRELKESVSYFIAVLVLLPPILSFMVSFTVYVSAILYRYIKPHEGI